MLFDGEDIVEAHVLDLKTRIETIGEATGKTVYAYDQEEFLDKAKILQFPAVGIFYAGLNIIGDKRSESGELLFDLVIADDTISGCGKGSDTTGATTLLSLIRQVLNEVVISTEKHWSFKSEASFDLGEKTKIGYLQRWSAVVTKM